MDEEWVAFCRANDTELQNHELFKESIDSAKKIGSISLDLSHQVEFGMLSSEDYIHLANQLKDSNIESINLPKLSINDNALTTISAVLKHTNIKNLNLESNKFGMNGLLALSSAVKESKIEVLNLANNQTITNGIHSLVDSLPFSNVTSLNLGYVDLNFCCLKNLSDTLARTKITVLTLNNCCHDDTWIKYLSTKLSGSKIQSLNLSNNKMYLESLQSLANVLENTAITELNISSNKIDPTGATYLAEKLRKSVVQNLDIGYNLIESEGCLAIGNVIHLTQISKLNLPMNFIDSNGIISLAENLKKSKLKYLNLYGNNLRINGAQILANGIKHSQLEYLNVNNNQLSNVGMGMILDVLQCTNVIDFDLNCASNGMNVENMKLLTNAFKHLKLQNLNLILSKDKNIVQLFFNELKTLIELVKPDEILPTKNEMNLAIDLDFEISADGIKYILDVIKHFHMKKLILDKQFVYHKTWVPSIVEVLIDLNNPISNIKTLNLSGNGFGNQGAVILAENFKYLKLTRLELDDNEIGNYGVIAIAEELKNSQIRYLSLVCNPFSSTAARYLAHVVEQHPVRIRLDCNVLNGFSAEEQLVIKNINYMFLKAQLLVSSISDNSPVKYDKEMVEYFKAYEIFRNVDLLWESPCGKRKYDYNRINSQIRYNITKNFLKIMGFVNPDEIESDLLPTEMIIKICSYLQINDVKFNQ